MENEKKKKKRVSDHVHLMTGLIPEGWNSGAHRYVILTPDIICLPSLHPSYFYFYIVTFFEKLLVGVVCIFRMNFSDIICLVG